LSFSFFPPSYSELREILLSRRGLFFDLLRNPHFPPARPFFSFFSPFFSFLFPSFFLNFPFSCVAPPLISSLFFTPRVFRRLHIPLWFPHPSGIPPPSPFDTHELSLDEEDGTPHSHTLPPSSNPPRPPHLPRTRQQPPVYGLLIPPLFHPPY